MSMEQFSNREPEPNGPIDDPLSHNAHLKVGGLETHARAFSHAGDCTIYAALINGCATDGICTRGYGWSQAREGDSSQMVSAEREGVQQPKGETPCQACAEKDQQLFDSDNQVKMLCADWAEDDTAVKSLAAPYIGDFDAARPAEGRGLGFRGVVEVTEALVAKLAEKDTEIARLTDCLDLMRDEFQRISILTSDTEILSLCRRAVADIGQNVPVIVQRDNAEKEVARLKEAYLRAIEIGLAQKQRLLEARRLLVRVGAIGEYFVPAHVQVEDAEDWLKKMV